MKKIITSHIEDDGTRKAKVALYNVMNGDHKGLKEAHGQVLGVTDYAIFMTDKKLEDSETGEITNEEQKVLVLFCNDGNSYATTSVTATKAIQEMEELLNDMGEKFPLDEPLSCKVISGKCDLGTWYGLQILD